MIVKKSHFALSLCFVLLSSFCMSCQKQETFTNWKDNSTPINELINYVEIVTNQNSQYFISQEDRDEKDMHYSYTPDDELLMGDSVIIKNVKMSKVAQLEQELGQKPVLAFGNSTGDVPMAHYVDSDNPYLTEVFFVLCDDITREHGNISKADKISSICNEFGWNTISMADDWKTIYGDNVTLTNQ